MCRKHSNVNHKQNLSPVGERIRDIEIFSGSFVCVHTEEKSDILLASLLWLVLNGIKQSIQLRFDELNMNAFMFLSMSLSVAPFKFSKVFRIAFWSRPPFFDSLASAIPRANWNTEMHVKCQCFELKKKKNIHAHPLAGRNSFEFWILAFYKLRPPECIFKLNTATFNRIVK